MGRGVSFNGAKFSMVTMKYETIIEEQKMAFDFNLRRLLINGKPKTD